jgi:hypothetical protein
MKKKLCRHRVFAFAMALLLTNGVRRSIASFVVPRAATKSNYAAFATTTTTKSGSLPPREYGYRAAPFSWSELQDIVLKQQNLAKLSRSVAQEETYQRYCEELLQECRSVYDHILHSKFGYLKRFNATTERWEAYPPTTTATASSRQKQPTIVLVPNDFPYYAEAGIEHWVLWKLHASIEEGEVDKAKADLKTRMGDVLDMIYWENPPHLKSLPDIDHVHILVQRASNRDD